MPGLSGLQTHRGFIFAHDGDPRVAASVTLAGIIAVLIGGVFVAIGPPLKTGATAVRPSSGQSAKVRIVGAAPRDQVSCEQQTWPNIEQRCLVRSKVESSAGNTSPATPDKAKPSPLTATGSAESSAPAAPNVTTGATPPNNVVTQAASPGQEAVNAPLRPDATVGYASDETQELPPPRPAEPVRKRAHRNSGFPFKFPFRF
jgi:hypothetical protein